MEGRRRVLILDFDERLLMTLERATTTWDVGEGRSLMQSSKGPHLPRDRNRWNACPRVPQTSSIAESIRHCLRGPPDRSAGRDPSKKAAQFSFQR